MRERENWWQNEVWRGLVGVAERESDWTDVVVLTQCTWARIKSRKALENK